MKNLLVVLMLMAGWTASAQEVYTSSGKPPGQKRKELDRRNKKNNNEGFDPSRLVVGGTLGFGMADRVLAFSIAPIIGYRITDRFAAGIGFGYQYYKHSDFFEITDLNTNQKNLYDYKASMISASVWARYLILEKLFAHVEYEHNFFSYQDYRHSTNPQNLGSIEGFKQRLNVPSALVGIGYRQPIGENASLYLMGFYDVLQRDFSPYRGGIQPRIGFTIGF